MACKQTFGICWIWNFYEVVHESIKIGILLVSSQQAVLSLIPKKGSAFVVKGQYHCCALIIKSYPNVCQIGLKNVFTFYCALCNDQTTDSYRNLVPDKELGASVP